MRIRVDSVWASGRSSLAILTTPSLLLYQNIFSFEKQENILIKVVPSRLIDFRQTFNPFVIVKPVVGNSLEFTTAFK